MSDATSAGDPNSSASWNGLRRVYESERTTWAKRDPHIAMRLRMIDEGCLRPPERIVDLGCGPADNTLGIAQAHPDAQVIGVDWSTRALTQARSTGLNVVSGDLDPAKVPLRSASCDVVMLCEVIEHLVHTDEVVAEANRILKRDGLMVISTPNLAAWFNRIMVLGGVQPAFSEVSNTAIYGRPGSSVVGHLRLFTLRALREFVEDNGFEVVAVGGCTYHDVPRAARWVDRLAAHRPSLSANLFLACRPRGSA